MRIRYRLTHARCLVLGAVLALATTTAPALAQEYGTGASVVVPSVTPGSIVLDGQVEYDVWDTGTRVNLLAHTSWWMDEMPDVDVPEAYARLLFSQDTLYVFAYIDDNELYANENEPWKGDYILVGVDPVHEAGETDQLVDENWSGWPDNVPDQGPYAYKVILTADSGAVTLDWGNGPDPVAAGHVRAAVIRDEENVDWGVEMAIYVPGLTPGAEIGFNVGGGQGNAAADEAYGNFSWQAVDNPGGDVQHNSASFATLRMAGGGEGYGGGLVLQVPRVAPGSITFDGVADEAVWESAQTDVEITANWVSYGPVGDPLTEPDLFGDTKLLWSDDTLYVFARLYDVELFWGGDTGSFWNSDMILVGLDNSHAGDSTFGPNYDGGIENAPLGPHTYFINMPAGFTIGWSADVSPSDSGWVKGAVYVDESALEWGIEAAFHMPAIEMGAEVGFDIGGAQASEAQCEEGYCDYAYFAWQSGSGGTDPGAINRDAIGWATLRMVETIGTAVEEQPNGELPDGFGLAQNFPNPFNPSTTITYDVAQTAHVTLDVFDVTGRKVATLVDGVRTASSYNVRWEAGNLPSGVYFYQLRADGQLIDAKKMLLVK